MRITLTNDFHNTEVAVNLRESQKDDDGDYVLSKHQTNRVYSELCTSVDCCCGAIRGPQDRSSPTWLDRRMEWLYRRRLWSATPGSALMDWSKIDPRYTVSNTVVDWSRLYASLRGQEWTIDCKYRRVALGTYSKEDTNYIYSMVKEFSHWLCVNHPEKFRTIALEHDKGDVYIIEYR